MTGPARAGLAAVPHPDAGAFLARAGAWLMQREDENNLPLGLALALKNVPPVEGPDGYLFGTVEAGGEVIGCFFRTPPYKAGLTGMPLEAAGAVARALAERYPSLPAVFGPERVAWAAGRTWADLRGLRANAATPHRMYRVDRVTAPAGVPGSMRRATERELPLAHAWGEAFADEAGRTFATTDEVRQRWIERRELHLWEDGEPVSMAVTTGRTAHGVRIAYVYTPPERRGRGYASALVAALSQRELDGGARFCVLFTDLDNPTSNAIYLRVGYRPLCDLVDVEFDAGS